MGRLRQLTWSFDDEEELTKWMEGRDVYLTGDVYKYDAPGEPYILVSFLVDEDRHVEILRISGPLEEDDWDD